MDYLPQEIIEYVIDFIQLDYQTLQNVHEAFPNHKKTKDLFNSVNKYITMFDTPLVDSDTGILNLDLMLNTLEYLENNNNISIQEAKFVDNFIKNHDNNIDSYIRCRRVRGTCTLLMNCFKDYDMMTYLLFLGANPNYTTSKDDYHIPDFVMMSSYEIDIDTQAKIFVLLIDYGFDIYLQNGDTGCSMNSILQENPELYQKVLDKLK